MATATPPIETRERRSDAGLLTALLLAPASLWYLLLLVLPMAFVVVFSFGEQARNGGYDRPSSWTTTARSSRSVDPFIDSLKLAALGTALTLFIALPLAYFLATRAGRHKGLFILLLVIPFWTSFLIRTYSWLIVLGRENVAGSSVRSSAIRTSGSWGPDRDHGRHGVRLPAADDLPAVRDTRADGPLAGRGVQGPGSRPLGDVPADQLPIALPGVITGSILVFIPMIGEYVIPQILGYGRTFLIGNALVLDFLEARNWPLGAAKAVVLIAIMLVTIAVIHLVPQSRTPEREVSVL